MPDFERPNESLAVIVVLFTKHNSLAGPESRQVVIVSAPPSLPFVCIPGGVDSGNVGALRVRRNQGGDRVEVRLQRGDRRRRRRRSVPLRNGRAGERRAAELPLWKISGIVMLFGLARRTARK